MEFAAKHNGTRLGAPFGEIGLDRNFVTHVKDDDVIEISRE